MFTSACDSVPPVVNRSQSSPSQCRYPTLLRPTDPDITLTVGSKSKTSRNCTRTSTLLPLKPFRLRTTRRRTIVIKEAPRTLSTMSCTKSTKNSNISSCSMLWNNLSPAKTKTMTVNRKKEEEEEQAVQPEGTLESVVVRLEERSTTLLTSTRRQKLRRK